MEIPSKNINTLNRWVEEYRSCKVFDDHQRFIGSDKYNVITMVMIVQRRKYGRGWFHPN